MSSKQITITVAGPVHSGKTYLMEKIADMLKAEGLDCKIGCQDGDFGKIAEARALGKPIPTLKEVLVKCDVEVSLVEKHLPTPMRELV